MTIDFAALKAKLAATKSALKPAGTTIKPKTGKNRYVILPPYKDGTTWHHEFGKHYIKDSTDTLQAAYICADKTHGESCPICNAMSEAQRTAGSANPEIAELVKKAYARQEYLIGVLALDSDTPDMPQVMTLGKRAFEQLVTLMDDWMTGIFDANEPTIIVIERTGTTALNTVYTVQATPAKYKVKKALVPIDLDEFVKMESEAAEKKALLALKNVAGSAPLLAGPVNRDRPMTKPVADEEFEDVTAEVGKAYVAPAAPAITDDIDALLGDLEVTV